MTYRACTARSAIYTIRRSHDTDMVSEGVCGVPAVLNDTANSLQSPQGIVGSYGVHVQPVLCDEEPPQLNVPQSLQLLRKLEQTGRGDAVRADIQTVNQ